ncbi:hypothetical protein RB195_022474 [Necator americanus]|uniref:Uncharacterized protein n=1 Tax=Necator americanus TaxID=51031 RepID=A0ABR1EFF2_NECAM
MEISSQSSKIHQYFFLLLGCITHMFYFNRLRFSAALGVILVLFVLQVFGCTLALSLYKCIQIEMLYYY